MDPRFIFRLACMWLVILLAQPLFSQKNPETVIRSVIEQRKLHRSLSYDVRFLHKSFSREDTLVYNAHVDLIRVPGDSLFHGHVLIKMDTVWYGYDGHKVFQRNMRTNEVLYDNAATSPGLFI